MIIKKELESKDNSSVQMTVTISKDAAKQEYEKLLTDYAKKVQIKGFRKGKVPPSVLEKKYGEGIKEEAGMNVIEESLKTALEEVETKPLPYSIPELQESTDKFDFDKDFTYSVVYDVFPEVKLGSYTDLEVEIPDAKVLKKDEDRELEKLRDQNAVVMEKDGGKVAKDDIVTINYSELDEEGNEIEGSAREDYVFTVGTGYNIYKLDDDIIGMAKDEEKVVEKEVDGKNVKIKVKVTSIKEKQLPELDDELAQDISDKYETIKDLRDDIKKALKKDLEEKMKEIKTEKILAKIAETSEIPLPESMIKAELENSWHNFVRQSQMQEDQLLQILAMQGKNKDDLMKEWRDGAIKSLNFQLIMNRIIEEEKIEASEKEIEEEIKLQAEASGQSYEEFKELIEKNNYTDHIAADVKNKKLLDFLFKKNTFKKGEKVNFIDLIQNNF